MLIFGDCNMPDLVWISSMQPSSVQSTANEAVQTNSLFNILWKHLCSQLVRYPRRLNNFLDLVIVHIMAIVASYSKEINMDISNHITMMLNMRIILGERKSRSKFKEYYQTNTPMYDLRKGRRYHPGWVRFENMMDNAVWDMSQAADTNYKVIPYLRRCPYCCYLTRPNNDLIRRVKTTHLKKICKKASSGWWLNS